MLDSQEVIKAADALIKEQDTSTYAFVTQASGGVVVEEWDVGIGGDNVYERRTTTPLSLWIDMLAHYSEQEIEWHDIAAITSTVTTRMQKGETDG